MYQCDARTYPTNGPREIHGLVL